MPILIDPPSFILFAVRKIVERGISQMWDTLGEDFSALLGDLWDAFPSPLKMLDVLLRFSTSLFGRIITIPFAGIEGLLLDLVNMAGYKHRVMTVEGCIKLITRAFSEVVTNLTGTSSSGLLGAVLARGGMFFWRLAKRISLIKAIFRWKTEADAIAYFQAKYIAKGFFYGAVLFVVAVFASIAWTGAIALLIGVSLSVATGEFKKYLMPQNKRRKRIRFLTGGSIYRRVPVS